MPTEHDKRTAGFLIEHPDALAAVERLVEEFGERIQLHVIEQADLRLVADSGGLVVGDMLVRNSSSVLVAVVHKDGEVERVDD